MEEFKILSFSGRSYTAEECISFSESPLKHYADIDKEMEYHKNSKYVKVCNLTQKEFDHFIKNYGNQFRSIYFFNNTKVKVLSALSSLENIEYLLSL